MTKRLENFSENDLNGARNRLQRGAPKTKEQKNLERFLEYKKGEVLRSGLVQEMQNELEERPIEMVSSENIFFHILTLFGEVSDCYREKEQTLLASTTRWRRGGRSLRRRT